MGLHAPNQRRAAFAAVLFLSAALGQSCTPHSELRRNMVRLTLEGQYTRAFGELQKLHNGAPERDLVMDLMDKGLLLHRMGRYRESNEALDRAKRRIDELYGVSVTDELAAIAWNESSKGFVGEEFERVMINVIMAFNYLNMGSLQDAAVEARQINAKLTQWVDRLHANKVNTSYTQDPFAQYLCGIIQEASGEGNDAFRSYEDALRGYAKLGPVINLQPPVTLMAAVLRAARLIGYSEAAAHYSMFSVYPDSNPSFSAGLGRIVVAPSLGEVAYKRSAKWIVPDPQGDMVVVTYPVFTRAPFAASSVSVSVNQTPIATPQAHDLSTLAIKEMETKNAAVKARAIAKALASYALKKAARIVASQSDNTAVQAISILSNLVLNVRDVVVVADTRSWMTLPDRYYLASAVVEPGSHDVGVTYLNAGGLIVDSQRFDVSVGPGRTAFVFTQAREGAKKDPPAGTVQPGPAGRPVAILSDPGETR